MVDGQLYMRVYSSKVQAVLPAPTFYCIQGTVHSFQEQSRIQQYDFGL